MTTDGVLKGKTARSLPPDEKYNGPEFEQLKGLPWNLNPPTFTGGQIVEDGESLRLPIYMPLTQAPSTGVKRRRTYVTANDVMKYGASDRCTACRQIMETGRANATHSAECRERMEIQMVNDEKGAERLERSARKKARQDEPGVPVPETGEDMSVDVAGGGPVAVATPASSSDVWVDAPMIGSEAILVQQPSSSSTALVVSHKREADELGSESAVRRKTVLGDPSPRRSREEEDDELPEGKRLALTLPRGETRVRDDDEDAVTSSKALKRQVLLQTS